MPPGDEVALDRELQKDASDATVAAVAQLYDEGAPPPQPARSAAKEQECVGGYHVCPRRGNPGQRRL